LTKNYQRSLVRFSDILVRKTAILLNSPKKKYVEGEFLLLKPGVDEAEFWEYADEDTDCELINGVLIIHSPASEEHEDIFAQLIGIFRFYFGKTAKGKAYGSRFVMKLSKDWQPEPDILLLSTGSLDRVMKTHVEGPADVVVEILSKATRDLDLTQKLPKYLTAGVSEVWIVDPEKHEIEIHTPETKKGWKGSGEELVSSTIFPDLKIKTKWIWDRDRYTIDKILTEIGRNL